MIFRLLRWRARVVLAHAVPTLALLICVPAFAQFKVIGPDGKVTYTDRAPNVTEGRVTALGAHNAPAAAEAELPLELRQVASRYPVTLYSTSGACEPCEMGRALLRQRGIPYTEKQVVSADDSDALEKLTGARDAPTLMIGSQVVRGMAADLWNSYLDAAGYPSVSKLPASYQYRAATPIVERREAAAPAPPRRISDESRPIERAPVRSGGIQF
ncbi:MAG: glutaredoxin family protein [Caldimonas sp.]